MSWLSVMWVSRKRFEELARHVDELRLSAWNDGPYRAGLEKRVRELEGKEMSRKSGKDTEGIARIRLAAEELCETLDIDPALHVEEIVRSMTRVIAGWPVICPVCGRRGTP